MNYLACDLGAESGRLMLGSVEHGKLEIQELHRFANAGVKANGSLIWDIPKLFDELTRGLTKAAASGLSLASISVDSWGLDYMLFDERGNFLPPSFHYRDRRCERGVKQMLQQIDWPTIFEQTGIQFMPMNTIFQLATESQERLHSARRLLLIADAFNYFLSGVDRAEVSLVSTSQLYNPRTGNWSELLLRALDLPSHLLPPIVQSGTKLGTMRPELAQETGLQKLDVIASCSHDTAAAVAAVPGEGNDWAYISSGTWSLLGAELNTPLIIDQSRELNFTNEIGFGNSVRLLKNIVGLWIVQECRRAWANAHDYDTLTRMAEAAAPFRSIINPADLRFVAPDNMPDKIAAYCRETNQPIPETAGQFIRCVLESLALLYRKTVDELERLLNRKIRRVHIVGGGSRNELLNQFTANALQRHVLAGPAEATAAGNILVQAIDMGELPSLAEARAIVRRSTTIKTFAPSDPILWDRALENFRSLPVSSRE